MEPRHPLGEPMPPERPCGGIEIRIGTLMAEVARPLHISAMLDVKLPRLPKIGDRIVAVDRFGWRLVHPVRRVSQNGGIGLRMRRHELRGFQGIVISDVPAQVVLIGGRVIRLQARQFAG